MICFLPLRHVSTDQVEPYYIYGAYLLITCFNKLPAIPIRCTARSRKHSAIQSALPRGHFEQFISLILGISYDFAEFSQLNDRNMILHKSV